MRAAKTKTEIRQDQIARAAMKLLAIRGWQRVRVAAIAREVGVVPSAVYRHFKGKDELLDAVLDLVEQSFTKNLRAAQAAEIEPIAQLGAAAMGHLRLIASGVPIPRIILSEDVLTGNPRHRKRVHAIYKGYLGRIAEIIRAGQARGLIRRELEAAMLSRMWLGLVQSPAILWLLGRADFDLQEHGHCAWRLFEECLRSGSSGATGNRTADNR